MSDIYISDEQFLADPAGARRLAAGRSVLIGEPGAARYVLIDYDVFQRISCSEKVNEGTAYDAVAQAPSRVTLRNLRLRNDVPDGWKPIYDRLVERLSALRPEPLVAQAKEKFGALRVHLRRPRPEAQALIDGASSEASRACQVCGASADLQSSDGFFATLCSVHAEEWLSS
jgi:hypothetical protein